jgi:hypothetical protein
MKIRQFVEHVFEGNTQQNENVIWKIHCKTECKAKLSLTVRESEGQGK